MASPRLLQLEKNAGTPRSSSPPPPAPGAMRSPVGFRLFRGSSPLSDDSIWRRLRDAGFDEDAVKRRDQATLVAYITRLETELYEYQHQMGLLLQERKDLSSKYEQAKASSELAEINYKREHASCLSSLLESKKREESLKKALDIERECISNIEKTLHEMRVESAEMKVTAESKLAEAYLLMEKAQLKIEEAELKHRAAESLNAEANRSEKSALRKLQDVESREDDIRRRIALSRSEQEDKENDLLLLRQSINDARKAVDMQQEKVLESQSLLTQREEHISERLKELDCWEKELEVAKCSIENETNALRMEESNLLSKKADITAKEKAIAKREALLDQRERELQILQETFASKTEEEIQRLRAENESILECKKIELEAEFMKRRKLVEDEIAVKRQEQEQREIDISRRENLVLKNHNDMELRRKELIEREIEVERKNKMVAEKERFVSASREQMDKEMLDMERERDDIKTKKLELEEDKASLEEDKKQLLVVQDKLEVTLAERNELLIIEAKLKEEIDDFRARKLELNIEFDTLRAEKEKFESEWVLMDEKKEELRKEAEFIARERDSVSQYLNNERENLKLEKDILLNQLRSDSDALSHEREELMRNMERERLEWFEKLQRERDAFIQDMEVQKRELELIMEKKQAEMDAELKEKEEAFEKEKSEEYRKICSLKEMAEKELKHIEMERQRLEQERKEIAQERETRNREWSEIESYIDELNTQREKLRAQRELLHEDRKEMQTKIQHFKKLEDLHIQLENDALTKMQSHSLNISRRMVPALNSANDQEALGNPSNNNLSEPVTNANENSSGKVLITNASTSPFTPANLSWFRKCVNRFLLRSPEKVVSPAEIDTPSSGAVEDDHVNHLHDTKQNKLFEAAGAGTSPASDVQNVEGSSGNDIEDEETFSPSNGIDKMRKASLGNGLEKRKFDYNEGRAQENSSPSQGQSSLRSMSSGHDVSTSSKGRKRLTDSSNIDSEMDMVSAQKFLKKRRQCQLFEQDPVTESNNVPLHDHGTDSASFCQEKTVVSEDINEFDNTESYGNGMKISSYIKPSKSKNKKVKGRPPKVNGKQSAKSSAGAVV